MTRFGLVLLLALTAPVVWGQELDLERLSRGTVMVLPMRGDQPDHLRAGSTMGSGTVVDNKLGLVVTNYHVVFDDDLDIACRYVAVAVPVEVERPPVPSYLFELVCASRTKDVALLRFVKALPGCPIPLGDLPVYDLSNPAAYQPVGGLRLNSPLVTLGYPGYQESLDHISLTVTNGRISGFLSDEEIPEVLKAWIKTDALVSWGNSGGTVIDSQGRFLGIPTQVMLDPSGGRLGRIRPVDLVLPFFRRIRTEPSTVWGGPSDPPGEGKVEGLSLGVRTGKAIAPLNPGGPSVIAPGQVLVAQFQMRGLTKPHQVRTVWRINGIAINDTETPGGPGDNGPKTVPLDWQAFPVPDGDLEFAVSIDGERSAWIGTHLSPPPNQSVSTVTVSGTTVDALTGEVVANGIIVVLKAGITVKSYDEKATAEAGKLVAGIAISDLDGRWSLPRALELGKTYAIVVEAQRYEKLEVDAALKVPKEPKDLKPIEIKLSRE